MSNQQTPVEAPRRRFLKSAAAASVATLGFPMVAKAQGPISMRWQSTWPAKDIFHEYANDFAKKVNEMAGSRLKIEVLPSGAVVPAFQLLEAVNKGTLDAVREALLAAGPDGPLPLIVRREQERVMVTLEPAPGR